MQINSKWADWTSLCVVTLMVISCHTSKKIDQTGPTPIRTQIDVLQALSHRNIDFRSLSIKGSADFESPDLSGSGSVQLRMIKDSMIWLQGKKFGIEGFRAIVNQDSAYMINRLEKTFVAETNKSLTGGLGMTLDFNDLQQLMVGNVWLPESTQISQYIQDGKECKLVHQQQGIQSTYCLNAYDLQLYQVTLNDQRGNKVVVNLDQYKKSNKQFLPFSRELIWYQYGEPVYTLKIDIDEVEWNGSKPMPFAIPSHYKKVRIGRY